MPNASIADLTTSQLRRAIEIKEHIEALELELGALLGATEPKVARRGRKKGTSRWSTSAAKAESLAVREEAAAANAPSKKRRKIRAAGRARMRAAAKARWAAAKAKGKNKL